MWALGYIGILRPRFRLSESLDESLNQRMKSPIVYCTMFSSDTFIAWENVLPLLAL